ncbi:MAG: hypothetical protein QM669_06090 [Siphonobacter sp.]
MKRLLLFVIVLNILMTWYTKTEILTEREIVNFYSTQLSYEQIEQMLNMQKKWEWLGYVFIPIFYLLKLCMISLCVYTGALLFNIKTLSWSKVFGAVVVADMIFLVPAIIKMVWFTFQSHYTLEDVQYFLHGSMLTIFEPKQLEPWLIYAIQSVNIWELLFFIALAFGLKKYLDEDVNRSMGLVMSTYGIGLVVWVVFITFLTLNFT